MMSLAYIGTVYFYSIIRSTLRRHCVVLSAILQCCLYVFCACCAFNLALKSTSKDYDLLPNISLLPLLYQVGLKGLVTNDGIDRLRNGNQLRSHLFPDQRSCINSAIFSFNFFLLDSLLNRIRI